MSSTARRNTPSRPSSRRPGHTVRLTSLACVAAMLLASCADRGSSGGGQEGGSIRVSIGARVLSMIPALAPAEQGGFSDGMKVEVFDSGGGAAALQALISGDVLLAGSGGPEAVNAAVKSKQTKVVATLAVNIGTEIVVSKKLAQGGLTRDLPLAQRVQGMKGLKIGITSSGSTTDQLVRALMTDQGLNPDTDASIVALGGADEIVGALRGGSVDVVALSPPTGQIVEKEGIGEVLVSPPRGDVESINGMIYITFSARTTDLENDETRAKIVTFVEGVAAFLRLVKSDPDKAKEQGRKTFPKLAPEVFDAAWDVVSPGFPADPTPTEESIRIALDFQEKYSKTGPVDWTFDGVADASIAKDAITALDAKG
ncbi:MAG: PhnD/SsuA/transferrin family substrate-binding protein [Actinophytocola sp.]|nr:PhnD/SsuA/transferrin family substrate-binding protein [Actinophytocola sp.]